MREEVYDYLREYGFAKEELYSFKEENEKMYFTNLIEVNKNIDFLTNKGLTKEEIIYVFKNNPFMITVKNNKLEAFDKIYLQVLELDFNSIKKLIIDNPETYTSSPIELEKIIEYLKENKCTMDSIKELIIKNPIIINMNLDEFKKSIKFI